MIRISLVTIALSISCSFLHGQANLVPNPSFEDTVQCPDFFGAITYATPWYDATGSSPDYFNACSDSSYFDVPANYWGTQAAHTGNAYVGFGGAFDFVVDGREYPQIQLNSTLAAGVTYDVEFYVSLSDTSSLAISRIGLYFSDTAITGLNSEVLNVIPQIQNPVTNFITDTAGWTRIYGTYTAVGTENFITIGNFVNDSSTSSVPVGVNYYTGAYYYLDDVSVIVSAKNTVDESNDDMEFSVYPNPTSGLITIISGNNEKLEVCNVLGEVVYTYTRLSHQTQIDLSCLGGGVYWLRVGEGVREVVVR